MEPADFPRLFSDDYSSTGQRAWLEGRRGGGPEYWQDDYLGQLRFDSLVAPTLVVPDSHVFDGPFFLAKRPEQLREALGRAGLEQHERPALEIRGRAPKLKESLEQFLLRPGRDTLNAFVFKSIEGEALRRTLAEELGRTPATELDRHLRAARDAPSGVGGLLRACIRRIDPGVNAEVHVGPLEEGWSRWLDGADDVLVEAWPTYSEFDIAAGLAAEPPIAPHLHSEPAREALAEIERLVEDGSGHRSDASAVIASHRTHVESAGDESALRELELLDAWYSRGRYRALAVRHGCACVIEDQPWLPALTEGQKRLRDAATPGERKHAVALPDGILSVLGDLEPDQFRALVRLERRTIVRWWRDRSTESLERLADALTDLAPARERARLGIAQVFQPAGAAVGFGVGTAAGGPGVGSVLGGLAGAVGKLGLDRRSNERERVRLRILEVMRRRTGTV